MLLRWIFDSDNSQQLIYQTVQIEQIGHDCGEYHPGQEVRQVDDGLNALFQSPLSDLIQKDGKDDGKQHAEEDLSQGDDQRIGDHSSDISVSKIYWHSGFP